MANADQCRECITLTSMVAFALKESSDQLGGVRNETFGVLEDRSHSIDSIFTNVGMSVLETRSCGGEEGFNELGFTKLAQES